jgi:hypothetical protein
MPPTTKERFEQFKKTKQTQASDIRGSFEAFKQQRAIRPTPVASPEQMRAALSQAGPTKGILEDLPAGAIAGATAGTAIGGFPIGTAGGAVAGESLQQLLQIAKQRGLIDVPFIRGERAPTGPAETTRRVGTQALEQLAGEAGFRGVAKLVRAGPKKLLTEPFARSLAPEQREAAELLLRENIPFTPFDISNRTIFGRLEKFQEQAFISSGVMRRFNQRKIQAIEAFADRGLEKTGLKKLRVETGQLAKAAIDDTFENLESRSAELFKQATQQAGVEPIVPTLPIKRAAQEIKEIERLVKVPAVTKEDTGILSEFGKEVFEDVKELKPTELNFKQLEDLANDFLALGDSITFEQARAFQKRLGKKVAQLKGLPEGEAKILFRGFANAIDEIPNPQALESLTEAKEIFKKAINFRENTVLGKLAGKNPEDVFKTIFKPGNVTDIQTLRSVIPASDWNIFQRAFADDILSKSGEVFKNLDNVLKKTTDETLKAALDRDQIIFLRELAKASKVTRAGEIARGQRLRPGVSIINIVRGGMAISMLRKGAGGIFSAGSVFAGPPLLAKAMTSKGGAKLLTTGLTLKASSPKAAEVIGQIIDLIGGTATRTAIGALPQTERLRLRQPQPRGAQSAITPTLKNRLSERLR